MNAQKLRELADRLDIMEKGTLRWTGLHRISGGFANASLHSYEDGEIVVQVEYGEQDENGSEVSKDYYRLSPETMLEVE